MSNFLFSRRTLQRTICQLQPVLTTDQLDMLVKRLNRTGDQRLHAMWEAVMLNALAAVGSLRHEISMPNDRRPDFEVEISGGDHGPLLIIGDITTVSDAALDEQNPVEALSQELTRLAVKAGLNPSHFSYDIPGTSVGRHGNARMNLFLPSRGELPKLMKHDVEPWIRRLATTQLKESQLKCVGDGVTFALTYDVTRRHAGGRYLAYNVAASRDKNTLFRALKSKVRQLRGAPADAVRLIIAADGGCALLHRSPLMRSPGTYTAREVAEDFLRQNSTVDFVLLVSVDELRHVFGRRSLYRTKFDLVIAPPGARSVRVQENIISVIDVTLRRAVERIPNPIETPYNAARRCREPGFGPDMIGAYEMTRDKIRISARALQRLLAGEITPDDFLASYSWGGEQRAANPFRKMLRMGRLIESIRVEDGGERDDDWLEFSFGPPDVAAGPFRLPDAPQG